MKNNCLFTVTSCCFSNYCQSHDCDRPSIVYYMAFKFRTMVFKELNPTCLRESHTALEQWSACINETLNATFSQRCSQIMLSKINSHSAPPLTLKSTEFLLCNDSQLCSILMFTVFVISLECKLSKSRDSVYTVDHCSSMLCTWTST